MSNRIMNIVVTVIAILLVVTGVVVFLSKEDALISHKDPAIKHAVLAQTHRERVWSEWNYRPVEAGKAFRDSLLNPLIVKIYGEHVYVADHGDMKVKRFSLDGEFLNAIGNGVGEGPGEFGNITDFYVRGEDIWIVSLRSRNVSRFNVDGTYRSRFLTSPGALRIAGLAEHLVMMMMGSPELFQEVDTTGRVLKSFGDIVTDQRVNFLALQGTLGSLEDGGFVYVPEYAGYLYLFDRAGEIEKVVQTIDRIPFPGTTSRQTDSGIAFRAPESDVVFGMVNVDAGVLYELVYFKKSTLEERYSVLDRYDASSGAYLSTFRLPVRSIDAQVHGDRIYCLSKGEIVVFERE